MKSITFSQTEDHSLRNHRIKSRKGFSIVEVAIAMGVVTLLLTTFLGVFGPAQKNIQRALSTKDANRMKDTLSNEMSILRSSETSDYSNSFDKAIKMIAASHEKGTAVLMYQYKALPTDTDTGVAGNDGILPPYTERDGVQGRDYIIQTAVRTIDKSSTLDRELAEVDGPVFVVRMTQLVKDPDSTPDQLILSAWSNNQSGAALVLKSGITDPDNPSVKLNAEDYPKAVIAFRAEFFKLSANKLNFINSDNWDFSSIGNAVTEVNMAVRR